MVTNSIEFADVTGYVAWHYSAAQYGWSEEQLKRDFARYRARLAGQTF